MANKKRDFDHSKRQLAPKVSRFPTKNDIKANAKKKQLKEHDVVVTNRVISREDQVYDVGTIGTIVSVYPNDVFCVEFKGDAGTDVCTIYLEEIDGF